MRRFRLLGEPLLLDLVNTLVDDERRELLVAPGDLEAWLAAHPELPPARRATRETLAAVHELREAVSQILDARAAGRRLPSGAVSLLNRRSAAVPRVPQLDASGRCADRRMGDGTDALLADLADQAIAWLSDPGAPPVRVCEGPGCTLRFAATNARRRWCSPSLCGNRARVARHYERRRTS